MVTAMLVATLAAAVVATLASSQSQWMRSVELRRDQVQAQAIVLAGLNWSRQAIADDGRSGSTDHLGEPWALPLPPTPLENGSVEGRIVDAQGLLNLNNLAHSGTLATSERARLTRLFAAQGLPERSVDLIAAWLEPAATERAQETGPAPRPPDNAGLTRSAEIAELPGLDEGRFARIAPWIIALPAATPINVNTAPAEVLRALIQGIDGAGLERIAADRTTKPYSTVAEFRARLPQGASIDDAASLAVRSDYFLVTVRARQGESLAQGRALLKRRSAELPQVLWQTVE